MMQTVIDREGQRYFDEPVFLTMQPRAELVSPTAQSIAALFGRRPPRVLHEIVGHNRVQLRWVKPDGKGGLIPRSKP